MVIGTVVMPQPVQADGCNPLTGIEIYECVLDIASIVSESILNVISYFTALCGVALNMAIILTLNIAALYEATPAIKEVWVVIRNLSSIFIIFGLLYASILTILDMGGPNVKNIIGKVIIAGLLINFSLFFTKILIDASNLVSLQFYRAMTPNSQNVNLTKDNMGTLLSASFRDGGISDIFMAGLKIPTLYHNKQGILQTGNATLMILIHTVLGSMLLIIAGLSFLAAAMAFVVRIAILILIMGFSPLLLFGIVFPGVGKYTKEYSDRFFGQLAFMPVYLVLLYAAMKFIGGAGFFKALNDAQLAAATGSGSSLLLADAGLIFQFVLALILINIPLIAALKMGGVAPKWADGVKDMAGNWVKGGMSFAGQHGFGRAAKAMSDGIAKSDFATRNPNMAILASSTLGKVSGGSFGGTKGGYDKRFKDYSKARVDYGKKLKTSEDEANNYVTREISNFDNRVIKQKAELGNRLNEIKKQKDKYNKILESGSPAAQELALKQLKSLEAEEGRIKEKMGQDASAARASELERLKKAAKNLRSNTFAQNLGEQTVPGFFTNKANKDAADAIRKELNKSNDDKMLDALNALASKDGGGDKKESKP